MKASGAAFLSVLVLLGLVGRQAVEGWTSYLQSLSGTPFSPSTAPPSYPSTPKVEEDALTPPATNSLMTQQGDYLSYLSSPRPLLNSHGDYNVGLQQQPSPPSVAQEIVKSTTGTDYLSRLSSGSGSSSPTRQKVVYSASPTETPPSGATDYLSQLSVRPRDRRTTTPNQDSKFQTEAPTPTLPPSTLHSRPESQNGANYLSFLSSPPLPPSSLSRDDSGVDTPPNTPQAATRTYIRDQPSQPLVKPSTTDPDPKTSETSTDPAATSLPSSTATEASETSKASFSPFGAKPKSVQGSSFSAVGTSYMNFLGTGPSRTSWYAEPLYAKPMRRRKVEQPHDKAKKSDVTRPEVVSSAEKFPIAPSGPTEAAEATHREESTHTSTTSSSYLSSLCRPARPEGVLQDLSRSPSPSSNFRDVGYLASLNTKAGGHADRSATIAASMSVAIHPLDYLSSLSRGKYVTLAPLQTIVAAQKESSSRSAQYLSALTMTKGHSPVAKTSSFSRYGRTPQAVTENGYLAGLSGRHESSTSLSSRPSVKIEDRTNYSPFGKMPQAVAPTGYLSNLAGGNSRTPSSAKPENYSPFGKMPKSVAPEAGYLSSLARREAEPSPAVGSSAPPKNYSPFGLMPKVVVSTGYLSGLGSAPSTRDAPADTSQKNYSPFGRKPRAGKETGYLSILSATSVQLSDSDAADASIVATPKTYSPFGRKPVASLAVGYLGSLSTGGVPQIHTTWSNELPQLETAAALLKTEPKPSRGVLKPMASYHPVSGALVEITSTR